MTKKEALTIAGSILLFILLLLLIFCEIGNPEGGVAFLKGLFGGVIG